MENFLNRIDAAFYHITFPTEWESIKREGELKSDKNGQIFVLRSSDERIIFSLAIGQLPRVYEENELIIIKIPQSRNNFKASEIGIDVQSNEPTMPLQNIINRKSISIDKLEHYQTIRIDIEKMNKKSALFDMNKEAFNEFNESLEIIYKLNNIPMILSKQNGMNNYRLIELK